MESKNSQASAIALRELVNSMKGLKSKIATDVTITCVEDDEVEYEFDAHTTVVCPRSKRFTELLEIDLQDKSNDARHGWVFRGWSRVVVSSVLQYMYGLEYQVDSSDEKVPNMCIHACVWNAGEVFGIKGLKVMAAEKFGLALSQYNIYGTEVDFTFSFFEDFVKDVEAAWEELPRSNRILRGQVSMHIQSNIKEWASKEGAQARLVESSYRLIFREIQEQTLDSGPVLRVIRANYQEYLDAETGYAALEKDSGALTFDDAETEDAASEQDREALTFDNAETGEVASEKDHEASTFDIPGVEDVPSEVDSKFDDADADWV